MLKYKDLDFTVFFIAFAFDLVPRRQLKIYVQIQNISQYSSEENVCTRVEVV
jgi:hypothetical protein